MASKLYSPYRCGQLELTNRIVMAPMTRCFSIGGIPSENVAAYYRRRAEADVGLIVTEGTWIDHLGASNDPNVPKFFGAEPLNGWGRVLSEVHSVGGVIIPQLWHVGLYITAPVIGFATEWGKLEANQLGPSGIIGSQGMKLSKGNEPMTVRQIEEVIDAFASAATSSFDLGFDGIALHGGHGYLIDQFFWERTNLRSDAFGGSIARRARFAAEIVREIRRRTSPTFPILFRFSQWKLQDYDARLVDTPQQLEELLKPLADAGVDIFDCSQRRFWEPAFVGSDLNLAGWTKRVTGKPTMTVGSVGLDKELFATLRGESSNAVGIERLEEMLGRDDFDLVAVGRALLADPNWARKMKNGDINEIRSYEPAVLATLT